MEKQVSSILREKARENVEHKKKTSSIREEQKNLEKKCFVQCYQWSELGKSQDASKMVTPTPHWMEKVREVQPPEVSDDVEICFRCYAPSIPELHGKILLKRQWQSRIAKSGKDLLVEHQLFEWSKENYSDYSLKTSSSTSDSKATNAKKSKHPKGRITKKNIYEYRWPSKETGAARTVVVSAGRKTPLSVGRN